MCGIFGVIDRKGGLSAAAALSRVNLMAHRGPDGTGAWCADDGRVALAHRRLAVVDLSQGAGQPMRSKDGRHTIVFNGEIYNYKDIRAELQCKGVHFLTSGDTEVLLAAYRRWGAACVERLNGMFAFAIHDAGTVTEPAKLFVARDRAGEKPFYYMHDHGRFSFASEVKALAHGQQIDLQALNHYLSLGYVPRQLCLFAGVNKLPPAHCGEYNLTTGSWTAWRYWTVPAHAPVHGTSGDALAERAGALVEDAVRLRLEADVPVGVLLSGGLDSSLVVAAAARVSASPVETFTIALPGSPLDEARHAQIVASHFGTRHHVLPLAEASLRHLDQLQPFIDEPIGDSSILPAWLVFGLARQHVTVALGGDGGDELFGGYGDYTTSMRDHELMGWVPPVAFRALAGMASLLPGGVVGRNRLASLKEGPFQQLIWGRPYFDARLRRRLLKPEVVRELGCSLDAPEMFLRSLFERGVDPLDSMTRTHFGSILPDDFLVKVDRASMARSLEVRAPFLDHRLVEFAFGQVPAEWKVAGGVSRRLQRLLAGRWLPPALDIDRKQGFSIPINEWLRQEGRASLMARLQGLPDLFEMDDIKALVEGHLSGRTNGGRLFALIMLALAMRNAHGAS